MILDIGIKFGQTRSMCLQLQLWRPPKPINYRLHFKTMTTIVVMNLDKVLSNVTYVATAQLQSRCSVPIKRRRLTACVKAEKSHITENSSVGLGSDKLGFSRSSSFRDANQNVCDSVSHQQQQKESFTASLADRSVEENDEKGILKDCYQRKSVPCVQVEKCKSSTFNRPKVPSKSVNIKTMATAPEEGEHGLEANDSCLASATQEIVEQPLRTPCDVDSLEQQPDINPRRQSTRNRSLTVRALECIANEFLHVQSRHKRRDTH